MKRDKKVLNYLGKWTFKCLKTYKNMKKFYLQ